MKSERIGVEVFLKSMDQVNRELKDTKRALREHQCAHSGGKKRPAVESASMDGPAKRMRTK